MVAMLPVAKFVVGTSLGNQRRDRDAHHRRRTVCGAHGRVLRQGGRTPASSRPRSPWARPRCSIIWKVIIPEAKPALITGAVISTVTILGYSAMAGTIGGGGLGQIAITYGYQKYDDQISSGCAWR